MECIYKWNSKYVEKLTFSNIQRGKETEFSNNDEKSSYQMFP